MHRLRGRALRRYRKHVQLVFQDPFSALNPVTTVWQTLSRPLRNHLGLSASGRPRRGRRRCWTTRRAAGRASWTGTRTSCPAGSASGWWSRGRWRPEPSVLVADEPISMLDVSIRAEIVELLDELVRKRDLAMLYITHDLLSARLLADEVLVLQPGSVVEDGPTLTVIRTSHGRRTPSCLLDALPNPWARADSR